MAREANVKTLVLSHLVPPDDPEITQSNGFRGSARTFDGEDRGRSGSAGDMTESQQESAWRSSGRWCVDAGVAFTAPLPEDHPGGFLIRQLMCRMPGAPPDGRTLERQPRFAGLYRLQQIGL